MGDTLHLHGARIWTGSPVRPWASSITLDAGRVLAVDGPPPSTATVLDGGGGVAIPGLIDAHVHLILGGTTLGQLDLSMVSGKAGFQAAIGERSAALAPGAWLIAHGWDETSWGGPAPDANWLATAGDRPVVAYRVDLHAAVVNQAVLQVCDTADDPEGGYFARDGRGAATGLAVEQALWRRINPIVPVPDDAEQRAHVRKAIEHAHTLGVTAVGTMEYRRSVESVLDPLRESSTLRWRTTLLDRDWPLDRETLEFAVRHDDVIGMKAFADGTLGSRTARLCAPYADGPGGHRGLLVELAAEGHLRAWAQLVAHHGLQPAIHAIGDEAAAFALDALEDIPRTVRPRVEHAQIVAASDLSRFDGVVAGMQPLHRAGDALVATARLGEDRLDGFFAFNALESAGAILAFGSDWPVVSLDPLAGIRAAVTALDARGTVFRGQEAMTVERALVAYTRGAAFALHLDDAGVLEPGRLGDVTLLDRDPFTAEWATAPPRVRATIVGGKIVYARSSV